MKLESAAYSGHENVNIPVKIKKKNDLYVLDTSKILSSVLNEKLSGERINDIALAGQKAVSVGLAELAIKATDKAGVNVIGGSGGVFYNEAISTSIKETVESAGYNFIQHKNSCAGDGSVSMGQAAVAAMYLK
jgi:hydrogenase maturation protein HypF